MLVAGLAAATVFLLSNPEGLKPQLAAWITEETDYQVELRGPLSWQFWPTLELTVRDLSATTKTDQLDAPTTTIDISLLEMSVDWPAIWRDVDRWKIDHIALQSATITEGEDTFIIDHLQLQDFRPGQASSLQATITQPFPMDSFEVPVPLQITTTGDFTYTLAENERLAAFQLDNLTTTSPAFEGQCNAQIRATEHEVPAPVDPDALLPLDTLAAYDGNGRCLFSKLRVNGETFTNVDAELTNLNGRLEIGATTSAFNGDLAGQVTVDIPNLQGGEQKNVPATEPRWDFEATLAEVNSKEVFAWAQRPVDWQGPLSFVVDGSAKGNTAETLNASRNVNLSMQGQAGTVNVAAVKAQLQKAAALIRRNDFDNWPERWDYQSIQGQWTLAGTQLQGNLLMDHLSASTNGTLKLDNTVDVRTDLVFAEAAPDTNFRINPVLQDTPIPVRCSGPAENVSCNVDRGGLTNLIAGALSGNQDSGLKRKIEEKIEEEVPEQYRDAARNLLELLGRTLQSKDD